MEKVRSFGCDYDPKVEVEAFVTRVRNSQLTPDQVTLLMEMVRKRDPRFELSGVCQILSDEVRPYAFQWQGGEVPNPENRTFSCSQDENWFKFRQFLTAALCVGVTLESVARGLICAHENAMAKPLESKSRRSPSGQEWNREERKWNWERKVKSSLLDVLRLPDQRAGTEAFLNLPICKSLLVDHKDRGEKVVDSLQGVLQESSPGEMCDAMRSAAKLMGRAEYLVYRERDSMGCHYISLGDHVLELLKGAFVQPDEEQRIAV